MGCADAALSGVFRHFGRTHAPRIATRTGPGQARLCLCEPHTGFAGYCQNHGHRGGGGRGDRGWAGRRVPLGRLADRLRYPDEHEHERGAVQPRQRDAGWRQRPGAARAPERRSEPEPVEQRCFSYGHARGSSRCAHAPTAAGLAHAARHPGGQSRGFRRYGENWPYAFAGRHAADPGARDFGLGRAAAACRAACAGRVAAFVRTGARGHGRRHGPECTRRAMRRLWRRTWPT